MKLLRQILMGPLEEVPWNSQKSIIRIGNIYSAIHQILGLEYPMN